MWLFGNVFNDTDFENNTKFRTEWLGHTFTHTNVHTNTQKDAHKHAHTNILKPTHRHKYAHFQMSLYRANKLFYYWIVFYEFWFQNPKTIRILPLNSYLRKLYSFWDILLLVQKNGQNLKKNCDISNFHLNLDCNNFLMSSPILTNLYLI